LIEIVEGEARMFADLNIFRTAHSMAVHAGKRQAVVAQNIANADTPGYKPMEIKSFSQVLGQAELQGSFGRENLHRTVSSLEPFAVRGGAESPNGNAVSIEQEMVKAANSQRQHNRAIAIYKSGLSILRTTLGRR
jgi:flagellar basal-body rod protein FlgB